MREKNHILCGVTGSCFSSKIAREQTLSAHGAQQHKKGMHPCVDTSREAALLARKLLDALARNCVAYPPLSLGRAISDECSQPSMLHKSRDESKSVVHMRKRSLDVALRRTSEVEIPYRVQNSACTQRNPPRESKRKSNGTLVAPSDDSHILHFVKAIDDVHTNFVSGSCAPNELHQSSGTGAKCANRIAGKLITKENKYPSHIEALERILDGNDELAAPTASNGLAPSTSCVHRSVEDKFKANSSLERKKARERRRAIARQRTLLKRKAEESKRMQKVMQELSQMAEEEKLKELKKIQHQQRENELRIKLEEKRRLGRLAVAKCRGKAGRCRKALEAQLKMTCNENQKLKRVLAYLAKSGVLSAEELRQHRMFIATERMKQATRKCESPVMGREIGQRAVTSL
eukprot:TRINITY_DN1002_c0_g1_i1.p3 TRINITY_DN1002_c0_g1~~TRINITY_DN1002_c0_g1_i1.p3  ORF type:complete len:404 (-),score=86.24 TRINITY_DN1002_c0_g1_i1:3648-4859(-)